MLLYKLQTFKYSSIKLKINFMFILIYFNVYWIPLDLSNFYKIYYN